MNLFKILIRFVIIFQKLVYKNLLKIAENYISNVYNYKIHDFIIIIVN